MIYLLANKIIDYNQKLTTLKYYLIVQKLFFGIVYVFKPQIIEVNQNLECINIKFCILIIYSSDSVCSKLLA